MTSGAFSLRIWCDQPSPIVVPTRGASGRQLGALHFPHVLVRNAQTSVFGSTSRISTYQYPAKQDSLKTTRWSSSYKEPMYSMYVLNLPRTHLFHPKPLKERGYLCVHIYIIWYMDTFMHIVWKAWCHAPVQMSEASGMHFCRQETLQIRRSVFSHPHDVLFQT